VRALDSGGAGAGNLRPTPSAEASSHVANLEEIMNPNFERLTFAIILIPLGQLCYQSGKKIKGVLLTIAGVLMLISAFRHGGF
jgi:hypothetical protein